MLVFVEIVPIEGRSGKNKLNSYFPDGNKWGNCLDKVLGRRSGQQMSNWKVFFLG